MLDGAVFVVEEIDALADGDDQEAGGEFCALLGHHGRLGGGGELDIGVGRFEIDDHAGQLPAGFGFDGAGNGGAGGLGKCGGCCEQKKNEGRESFDHG